MPPNLQRLIKDFRIDEAMRTVALPINPDLEIEAETVFTWHIQDWRNLERREHGPVMMCGGCPWYAIALASPVRLNNCVYIRS